ncbi:PTS system,lactose/cellobiose-specific,EIIBcomponent [Streptococcus infantarius subsp. infantarius]|nr:PTS system,lactose/cellobiose-specific,EIIBcomponent [Streptococcus infantarius subsp. infantarius]MCO4637290.1 PTS system,lactose/cellobiose-specific,EIIBcomponent [Streptococcus infantarius subsp. infantarius]MCO4642419.1 PTS system,lactose/cellobiose-specific,EIIBcomponent [Streptococcus infantarius subsp. infantarius]MCO4643253.1 PTS system,lactose/cellobiose-specific,EIIBcomponent [Streptococcus infantarius subsp. infantarius]MCO4651149.1 PTS system,lactose/cellobiose-specific,EIIBcompo
MAKQALIICAGGMSSSMIAKKTMTYLQEKGEDIEMNAVGVPEGQKRIETDKYDLYLVSPQTKMNFKQLADAAAKTNKPIIQIPPQAYIPIPMGIEKWRPWFKKTSNACCDIIVLMVLGGVLFCVK